VEGIFRSELSMGFEKWGIKNPQGGMNMHLGIRSNICNYIRRRDAKYMHLFGMMVLVFIVFLTGCSHSTHQDTFNSSNSLSLSTPTTGTLNTENKIESSSKVTGDSSSITLTGSNFPDWFMNDLKLASVVKFPTKADEYSLNQDMGGKINYADRIKSFDFWNVTGINGQLWVAGYTGTKTVSAYLTYAGPIDMKEVFQTVTNAPNENNFDWGSLTPVLMFESDKITFVSTMSWDRGNGIWIVFAPDQVIIKSNHHAVDMYEVITVPGIRIPT